MKLFNYKGRLRRTTFVFQKINTLLLIIAIVLFVEINIIDLDEDAKRTIKINFILWGFLLYKILDIISKVKRFHDINKSGTNYFKFFIPIYGFFLGIGIMFERGTDGPNKYGNDPRAIEGESQKSNIRNGLIMLIVLAITIWQLRVDLNEKKESKLVETINSPTIEDFFIIQNNTNPEYNFYVIKVSSIKNDSIIYYTSDFLYSSKSDCKKEIDNKDFNMTCFFGEIDTVTIAEFKQFNIVSSHKR